MLVEITMPAMGESIMECTVLSVLKKVGDVLEVDDSILEVATDKVDTEVPSPLAGVIAEILVAENDVIKIGSAIVVIETGVVAVSVPVVAFEAETSAVAAAIEKDILVSTNYAKPASEIASTATKFFSPLVLNIAKAEGISTEELYQVVGTGAEQRVTKQDILGYIENRKNQVIIPQRVETPKADVVRTVSTDGANEIILMDRMRRIIAERMVDSKRTSPHVTSFVETDMTNVVLWRNKTKDDFKKQTGEALTFTPILIEAIVRAIKDFPMINVSVEGETIVKKRDINIGMAVALPSGNLIVPVIHRADQYSLIGLAKKVNDLANRARLNKLTADDLAGGTYTVSNIGTFGNVMGTPIIVQPQVAIMAFGAIQKKPAVIETPQGDTLGIRQLMFMSHAYDHRVVDGALGGMFVKRVSDYLEGFELDRKLF